MKKLLYGSLLCILPASFTAHAQNAFPARVADSMFQSLHREGKFNGNVLLAENGKVIFRKSYGLANRETNAPLDERSIFELASCSKQFTAMAIALLQHQGKLSVSDDFTRYIPELSFYKGITISDLVYHTSGLPDYMSLDSMWRDWDEHKIATNKDVIEKMARYKPALLFPAGTRHEYSNTGYMLLAVIIERASGRSFADYLQQYIFRPLQMTRSFVYSRRYAPKKVDNYAYGYVMDDSLQKLVLPDNYVYTGYVYNFDGIVGDGGVNSTVNDLLKWDEALYHNKLLPAGAMQAIFEGGKLKDGTRIDYGFGWFVRQKDGKPELASHSGGWPGYITYMERNMKLHRTIILLQNGPGLIPKKELRLLMDGKPIPPPAFKETQLPESMLAGYVGAYQMMPDMVLNVTREGSRLFGQATGQGRIEFYPFAEDKFFTKDIEAHMEFVKEEGRVTKLIWHQGGQTITAPRHSGE